MPTTGSIIIDQDGRKGEFVARTNTGDYVCHDHNGFFIVQRDGSKPRAKTRKPKAPKGKRAKPEWQPTTSWTTGGPVNPILAQLAERVKRAKQGEVQS